MSKNECPTCGKIQRKTPDDMVAGSIHPTNLSGDVEIIKYNSSQNVDYKFTKTGTTAKARAYDIRNGVILDPKRNKSTPSDMAVGTTFQTKLYGKFEIVEYINSYNVRIKFLNTGNEVTRQASQIRDGYIADDSGNKGFRFTISDYSGDNKVEITGLAPKKEGK